MKRDTLHFSFFLNFNFSNAKYNSLILTRLEGAIHQASSGFRRQTVSPVHCFVDQEHITYLKEGEQVFLFPLKIETCL